MCENKPPHERRGFTVVVRGVPFFPRATTRVGAGRCTRAGSYHLPMPPPRKSLMRCLGEFVGHVAKGIRTNPARKEIRREVEEDVRETDQGQVTLRRTTIEEIEIGKPGRR